MSACFTCRAETFKSHDDAGQMTETHYLLRSSGSCCVMCDNATKLIQCVWGGSDNDDGLASCMHAKLF